MTTTVAETYLGRWIARIYRATQSFMADRLRGTGIGHGQFPFLRFLASHDGVCQDEIARGLHFDKGTATRALQKLEQAGLVRRRDDDDDARRHLVSLTARGRLLADRIDRELGAWHGIITHGLPRTVQATLHKGLQRLAANAEAHLAAGRTRPAPTAPAAPGRPPSPSHPRRASTPAPRPHRPTPRTRERNTP
ncbi:MAG: winged helix-turn-helix transcriptional regulator [Candidatus Riflebacteria bacterium]|nr:winged helix-turn-helix transcriptional regulator [Candidatus Riflebacteria bacterium]